MKAREGAPFVVDATQGIQAQTLANAYLAIDAGLEVIPAINKIDPPSADVEAARDEIDGMCSVFLGARIARLRLWQNRGRILRKCRAIVKYHIPAPEETTTRRCAALFF